MRKFGVGLMAVFAALALMTSCSKEDAASSTLSDDLTVEERAGNPSVHGHVEIDSIGADTSSSGGSQSYTFNAVQLKDGRIKGQFQLFDSPNDSTLRVIHGSVTCFTIQDDGQTAFVGGVIRKGMLDDTTSLVGAEAFWTVVDNGQGENADPDEATEIVYGVDLLAEDHCADGAGTFVAGPVAKANVKVKP